MPIAKSELTELADTSFNPRTTAGRKETYDAYRGRVGSKIKGKLMSKDVFTQQQHKYSKSGEAGYVSLKELEKLSQLGATSAMTKKSSGFKMKGFSGFGN